LNTQQPPMANINNDFFDGYYKEIWRSLIPAELTVKEVDFMLTHFNLQEGSKVLDLMCGYGRHAVSLARKGISVTAIDNLEDYIREICETVDKEQLPLKAIRQDVLEYKMEEDFDLAICMGNSLNFFDEHDTLKLLHNISSHLVKGGHLLINSWSINEIVAKNFKEKSWSQIGDHKFLTDSKFFFQPTRIETESMIIFQDGKTEKKTGIDYIFSINELDRMLKETGLQLTEVYSIPGKKKFTLGEPRAYLVAEKK
jgi:cyclopropane fatty-acyl-phospholipid synthase-like methyltransferase